MKLKNSLIMLSFALVTIAYSRDDNSVEQETLQTENETFEGAERASFDESGSVTRGYFLGLPISYGNVNGDYISFENIIIPQQMIQSKDTKLLLGNGQPTITKKDGSSYSVQRNALSSDDLQSIAQMYPNGGGEPTYVKG